MNSISENLGNLQAVDCEIRKNSETSLYCCNGALGCQCVQCSDVRSDFLKALNRLQIVTAPPPPTELPPLPPSTLPPRMPSSKPIAKKPLQFSAPIPEDVPVNFCFSPNAPFRAIEETTVTDTASFGSHDLPLITRPLLQLEDGSIAGSDNPSELVSHISRERASTVLSTTDQSEWLFPAEPTSALSRAEWFYDSSNLAEPFRTSTSINIPDGTAHFDIASQRSESSWAPIYGGKVHGNTRRVKVFGYRMKTRFHFIAFHKMKHIYF